MDRGSDNYFTAKMKAVRTSETEVVPLAWHTAVTLKNKLHQIRIFCYTSSEILNRGNWLIFADVSEQCAFSILGKYESHNLKTLRQHDPSKRP
jgi:hypothetical protein